MRFKDLSNPPPRYKYTPYPETEHGNFLFVRCVTMSSVKTVGYCVSYSGHKSLGWEWCCRT